MIKKHKNNYHAHTYLCGHASGVPIDYIKEAINKGFKEIGISEHAPLLVFPNNNSRMKREDYPLYLKMLDEASILAKENNIAFYRGLEIEYHPDINHEYEFFLKDMDYLILGQHYIIKNNTLKSSYKLDSLEDVVIYKDMVIKALKTGYFNMLCHPDLCFYNIKNPTNEMYEVIREVIKVAKELNIPLEVNANGLRRSSWEDNNLDYKKARYPNYQFFKMVKEENAKVIVSSDSHNVNYLFDSAIEKSYKLVEELKLDVIYQLNMNYLPK